MQKGFATILILIGMLVVSSGIIGGIYYYSKTRSPTFDEMNPNIFPSIKPNPTNKLPPDTSPSETNSKYKNLVAKVEKEGLIKIIVSLDVPTGDEKLISEAQDELLNDLLPYKVSSVTKFKYTPGIAFEVNAEALNFLINRPGVKYIEEDQLISIPDCNNGPC